MYAKQESQKFKGFILFSFVKHRRNDKNCFQNGRKGNVYMGMKKFIVFFFTMVFALIVFPDDVAVADDPAGNVYDLADFTVLSANWLETLCLPPGLCDGADYTLDGTVGVEDMEYLANHWLAAQKPTGIVLVPAGEFQMGDSFAEGPLDERPVHAVLVSGFLYGPIRDNK
jgi:hypothetical protein